MDRLTPSSPQVQAMPVKECDEPLVDIAEASDLQFGPPPECPDTAPHYRFVRQTVLERLLHAQSLLPDGIYLRLYEGYRSLQVQQLLFDQEYVRVKQRIPELSEAQAYVETTRLVSAVHRPDGSLNVPPHATGGAVDVELVDANGQVLDFGMEIADWSRVDPDLCLTDTGGLSTNARFHRQMLRDVMERAGFVNYAEEWWHFSYGDQLWAYVTGDPAAIYGAIE